MRLPRIYFDGNLETGNEYQLDTASAHHLTRVLRLTTGDKVILFNGLGGEYLTQLKLSGKNAFAHILNHQNTDTESELSITLLQGISRGERMDMVIQKSVELGVSRIIPVFCQRTVVNLKSDRLLKKLNHWQGILINACEQSGRTAIPRLAEPVKFSELPQLDLTGTKLTLSPHAESSIHNLTPQDYQLNILIGPEGGLTDDEIEQSKKTGFEEIKLGPRILRTETAALTAIAVAQTLWGDFK